MKISCVVPTYNRPEELAALLDAVLMQTLKPFEFIVVDDNTPNRTIRDLCEKYEKSFKNADILLFYVRNPREQSAATSRNVGVKTATGDIIYFFDDDIVPEPCFIEKTVEVFEKYPNALGVQGWVKPEKKRGYAFFEALNRIFVLGVYSQNSCRFFHYPITLTRIIQCEALGGGDMAVKREVFDEFKFDETLKKHANMEDELFSYTIFKKYPGSLFITPYAKCIHKHVSIGQKWDPETERLKTEYRRYVLSRLFGMKGSLIFFWQSLGIILRNMLMKSIKLIIRRKQVTVDSERSLQISMAHVERRQCKKSQPTNRYR